MRKRLSIASFAAGAALAVLLAQTAPASAGVASNLGFETGNLDGWTIDGNPATTALVVTAHAGETVNYLPQFGTYFLVLKGGCPTTSASEIFVLGAGRTISGSAAFDAHDILPFNDSAAVTIYDKLGNVVATPFFSDVATVGNNGDGAWKPWTFTSPATAEYRLVLSSTNAIDCSFQSDALFDARGTTTTAAALVPGLGLRATLLDDSGKPVAGKPLHFTCGGCTDTTVVTDATGTASIALASDPATIAAALLAGSYCAEYYGDASANGSSGCAGRL